jgi:hypothetical protein
VYGTAKAPIRRLSVRCSEWRDTECTRILANHGFWVYDASALEQTDRSARQELPPRMLLELGVRAWDEAEAMRRARAALTEARAGCDELRAL